LPGHCTHRLGMADWRSGNALGRRWQYDFIRPSSKTFTPARLYSSAGARRHYFYRVDGVVNLPHLAVV